MTDKPTTSALLADEQAKQDYLLLRLTIARVLAPRPWQHSWRIDETNIVGGGDTQNYICDVCGKRERARHRANLSSMYVGYCESPRKSTDPMEVLADRLVKKFANPSLEGLKLWKAISQVYDRLENHGAWGTENEDLMWFILWATAAERCVCCLVALDEVEVG